MIYGIGVDTASAARLEKSIARAHFVQRVFGPEERALLQGRSPARRAETAAANFAAKLDGSVFRLDALFDNNPLRSVFGG